MGLLPAICAGNRFVVPCNCLIAHDTRRLPLWPLLPVAPLACLLFTISGWLVHARPFTWGETSHRRGLRWKGTTPPRTVWATTCISALLRRCIRRLLFGSGGCVLVLAAAPTVSASCNALLLTPLGCRTLDVVQLATPLTFHRFGVQPERLVARPTFCRLIRWSTFLTCVVASLYSSLCRSAGHTRALEVGLAVTLLALHS